MPIYAYQCAACGHAQDVLQKLGDAPLTECPSCQAESFGKQITAAGLRLKGSGWHENDFKHGAACGAGNKAGGGKAQACAGCPAAR